MKMRVPLYGVLLLAWIFALTGCGGDDDEDFDKNFNEAKVRGVLESMESGDTSKIEKYFHDSAFIQHNPTFADGKQGFLDKVNSGQLDGTEVRIWRIFTDGLVVVAHSEYVLSDVPKVGIDVFRFDADGFIVEHWDNLQDRVEPTAGGRTMLDGTLGFTDDDKTEENKGRVEDFVYTVLIGRQYDRMGEYFDGDTLYQHSPNVDNDMENWKQALIDTPEVRYTTLHKVIGEGNFVLTMSEGMKSDTPTAFYDLYHVLGGNIIEHWDVVDEIPPLHEWLNDNGKF